jgi:hypothetical protein
MPAGSVLLAPREWLPRRSVLGEIWTRADDIEIKTKLCVPASEHLVSATKSTAWRASLRINIFSEGPDCSSGH